MPYPASPHSRYLDRLMRRRSFAALWPLFAKADRPAKEMTESFCALERLKPFMTDGAPCRVVHVGDGAHARTAALFALKTKAENISVDSVVNEALVAEWRDRFAIERFSWRKMPIEAAAAELNALPPMRVLVTFVHAHVDVDRVLQSLRWDAAFSLICCQPGNQRTAAHQIHAEGEDPGVLSDDRQYQVLVNSRSGARDLRPDADPDRVGRHEVKRVGPRVD